MCAHSAHTDFALEAQVGDGEIDAMPHVTSESCSVWHGSEVAGLDPEGVRTELGATELSSKCVCPHSRPLDRDLALGVDEESS